MVIKYFSQGFVVITGTTKLLLHALSDGRSVSLADIIFDTALGRISISNCFEKSVSNCLEKNDDLFILTRKGIGKITPAYKLSEKAKDMLKNTDKRNFQVNDNLRLFHSLQKRTKL